MALLGSHFNFLQSLAISNHGQPGNPKTIHQANLASSDTSGFTNCSALQWPRAAPGIASRWNPPRPVPHPYIRDFRAHRCNPPGCTPRRTAECRNQSSFLPGDQSRESRVKWITTDCCTMAVVPRGYHLRKLQCESRVSERAYRSFGMLPSSFSCVATHIVSICVYSRICCGL